MVELVYTGDLKSPAERIEGSNPSARTMSGMECTGGILPFPAPSNSGNSKNRDLRNPAFKKTAGLETRPLERDW